MRLRLAVDGRERDVLVEGAPPDLRVTVNGRTLPVRLDLEDATAIAEVEGRTLRIEFRGGVRVGGAPRSVRVDWLPEDAGREGGEETVDVRPPMPGRIVRVLARAGETVRRGAALAVLEAMKMQNEIPSPVAGTVREVRVREGQAVAASDVLVRIVRGKG